ncbi:unnamed protein product [Candidula unifasciata]|uniref:Chromatin target of PRMT1 protein C-terminal domain-containing protein n=1 Tax=Candidula unifasciata TaxID=100452 RepID=A0A8S4A2Z9_9EUPU|nr:unnamed protein product [Candidula unifasciata]
MTSAVPTKIVLKSTTRMSLSDRFSTIAPTVQNIRAQMAMEHQVSAANQRLAQQLARRPAILATPPNMFIPQQRGAGGRRGNFNAAVIKPNVQQRLGKSNVKNRLSLPGGQPIRGRGRGRGRGGNISQPAELGDHHWVNPNLRGRGNFNPREGPRGRGAFRGRGRGAFNRFSEQNTPTAQTASTRGNSRGSRPGGRRGRGAGRGNKSNVSVADLDNQLDAYMAKAKTHLDSELEAYMSEVSK